MPPFPYRGAPRCLFLILGALALPAAGIASEDGSFLERLQGSFIKLACGPAEQQCIRTLGAERPWTVQAQDKDGKGPCSATQVAGSKAQEAGTPAPQGCARENQLSSEDAARLRLLAGHFVILAFAESGSRMLEDDSDRSVLAPALLQRVRTAEAELHGVCKILGKPDEVDAYRAVAYPLERADALVAVADVVRTGMKPSVRRLRALFTNPTTLLSQAGEALEAGATMAVYANATRRGFIDSLPLIVGEDKRLQPAQWRGAWKAAEERLEGVCRSLNRFGGGGEGEGEGGCLAVERCEELLFPAPGKNGRGPVVAPGAPGG